MTLEKISSSRVSRTIGYIGVIIGILALLVTPLYLNCYIKITDTGIIVNRLTDFREKNYDWDDIIKIKYSTREKSGDLIYKLKFYDNSSWILAEESILLPRERLQPAVEFIQTMTERELEYSF